VKVTVGISGVVGVTVNVAEIAAVGDAAGVFISVCVSVT